MSALVTAFGQSVRHLRKERGLSQEELAAVAGVHRTYVGMIERGEKNVTLDNINKIATALGVPVHRLMEQAEGRL